MVWAEMVMGRNGHGPKWLWAEMTSDRMGLLPEKTRVSGGRAADLDRLWETMFCLMC